MTREEGERERERQRKVLFFLPPLVFCPLSLSTFPSRFGKKKEEKEKKKKAILDAEMECMNVLALKHPGI